MRIVRFQRDQATRFGVVIEDNFVGLLPAQWSLNQFLAGTDCKGHDICNDFEETFPLDPSCLLAPVAVPPKVICIGKNYSEHAAEMGGAAPELPIIFSKFSSAVIGPNEAVVLPDIAEQVDYEGELVVVIGRPGKNILREKSLEHVGGYMCGNDVSARDWQKGRPGGQWLLGKTFDTFAPTGPWLVTPDEVGDAQDLELTLTLNGQVMQRANTRTMLYPVDYLIHHASKFFSLQTGDLIFTGTPAGVGAGRQPPVFLNPGDETTVMIDRIGSLHTRFVAEASS